MSDIIYKRAGFNPDFNNTLKVLRGERSERPVLFEYGINFRIIGKLSGEFEEDNSSRLAPFRRLIKSFFNAGYDYTTVSAWRTKTLSFPKNNIEKKQSQSLNAGNTITDRESFEKYVWPDPEAGDYDLYYDIRELLPDGMKIIAAGPGGLLENVIDLVGFENLSLMYMLDEDLASDIFNSVGSRLLRFYELIAPVETIGACIVNDDWGFKNQTLFPPEMLRQFIFPWHKKIVQVIHDAGKPAILHSCGQLKMVMDDVIDDMNYDAKHSFEDQITPVEQALEIWGNRIAILGGIDVDFIARSTPEAIRERSKQMLGKGMLTGGYALGSGNSIPEYIPDENFIAMISIVNEL